MPRHLHAAQKIDSGARFRYHTPDGVNYRVVGVLVWPTSDNSLDESACMSGRPVLLSEEADNHVRYTYTVKWKVSPTRHS